MRLFCSTFATFASGTLELLEHLERAFGGACKHALQRLRKATTLKRVAAGAFAFGHGRLNPVELSRDYTLALPEAAFFGVTPSAGPDCRPVGGFSVAARVRTTHL